MELCKPLGYGLSDGLSKCLAWSSVTLSCVPLLIHDHHWRCFCLGTSGVLLGESFLILIQDLHFALGRELDPILGAAFEIVNCSCLLETPLPLALGHYTLLGFFCFFVFSFSLSVHSFSASYADLSSSTHSPKYYRPSSLYLDHILHPLFILSLADFINHHPMLQISSMCIWLTHSYLSLDLL